MEKFAGRQNEITSEALSASPRSIILSLAWDIMLNASIPTACYFASKRLISSSEATALLIATGYPTLKSIYDLLRNRELNPVTVTVLLGIVVSLLALFLGGDPRILLIRESLFTGAFGIFCLLSLRRPRPVMFYFSPLLSDRFHSKFSWLVQFSVCSTAAASFNSWSRDCFSNGVTLRI